MDKLKRKYNRIAPAWNKGKKMPKSFGLAISERQKGRKLSEQTKQKMSLAQKGLTRSPFSIQARLNMSLAQKGKKLSKETRKKMSLARVGIKLSKETKKKMSIARKGFKMSEESKIKMSKAKKGKLSNNFGKRWKMSENGRKNISLSIKKGFANGTRTNWLKGKKMPGEMKNKISFSNSGEKNYRYIVDRTKLKVDRNKAYDTQYKYWMLSVKKRDGWKCKIKNQDCNGRLEAHHILSWKEHPELRYNIDNGITLCKFHHPIKRAEEKRLSPYFLSLIKK